MERLRDLDREAWQDFLHEADPLILSVVSWSKWHFDYETREDLQQIIRTELMSSIGRIESPSRLPGFVRRVCVHRCIDEVRRQSRERNVRASFYQSNEEGNWEATVFEADEKFDPVRAVILRDEAEQLRDRLTRLEDHCQSTIRRFYAEGLSYKEIAAGDGVSTNTVGSRLARCLEKLREMMDWE